jgi:hypothetical protein
VAAWTDKGIVKGPAQQLRPGDADVTGRGRGADLIAVLAQRRTTKRIVMGIGLLGDAVGHGVTVATG